MSGMEVVDEIAAVATDWNDKPRTPVVMEKVEIV
ncbi:peptidylprolyl isomerase [Gemmiger sp.]